MFKTKAAQFCFLFILFMTLTSCNHDDSAPQGNNTADFPYKTSVVLKDKFDQPNNIFLQGEIIKIELSIDRQTNPDNVLKFDSFKFYDVYIEDVAGKEVWRMSDNHTYKQEATELSFQASQKITFLDVWGQILKDGGNISTGTYTLFAFWVGYGDVAQTAITIN